MVTFGDLLAEPQAVNSLDVSHVLIAAATGAELVLQDKSPAEPETTIVFRHETIQMMMAERAEKLEKLRGEFSEQSVVVPLAKKPESFWEQITVGRASTADIVIEDPAVSNVHAHFIPDEDGEGMGLQDVGSSNGTFVNRVPLQPHVLCALRTRDCVRFGQTIFYYVGVGDLRQLVPSAQS